MGYASQSIRDGCKKYGGNGTSDESDSQIYFHANTIDEFQKYHDQGDI